METQNVTLAIPKPILRKAKLIAVERQISLSGLLTQLIADLVERSDQYAEARQRHLAWLEHGADLGTHGVITWTREELHER
jgi:hypothetical protein